MGDRPTWDEGRSGVPRNTSGRSRRGRDGEQAGAEALTVEQLLARQDTGVGRRRAARRVEEPVLRAPEESPPAVRAGLPPVPGASAPPARQGGLPPVPGAARPAGQPPLPPVPAGPRPQVDWHPDSRPVRRSGPVPPLPGRFPPPEPSDRPRAARPARPPRPPASPGRRRLTRALVALAAVLGVVVLYHLGLYFYVDQKIDRVDALAVDGPEILAPQLQAGDETYLVVGSGVPGQTGTASVAALLASVSSEGDRAVLVSFPPTALVDTPACRTPDGDLRSPATEAFASSLLEGGPSCMVRAVQQLSGLRVDHYLGVDLADLPGMVDALGGVPVCVVPSQATAAAATPLPAGYSEVSGEDAAGYLAPGDSGADVTGTAVAERAQRLLTSTLRAAMSTGTLVDPLSLNRFLNRAAEALTVDEQTTLGDLRGLAGSLGDLSGDAVQRASLPVAQVGYVPAGTDQAYVLLDGKGTRSLFDAVIEGTSVPEEFLIGPEDAAAAEEPPAGEVPPASEAAPPADDALTVPPASVAVDVLNGTATTGLAATVADLMRGQGFVVGAVGNEPGTVSETVVRYGPGVLEQARTVAASVPGAVLQPSDSIGDAVQLVIGPGYSSVVPVTVGAAPEAPAADTTPTPAAAPEQTPVSC
ncbi:LCP family protein [Blastococcus litoris]|uniref:LCP family protein n=1 Tax=Blastococcus litoris TaxID=2171622 RepID=UPI000E30529C|nr:LCP family protein [Blastococcus litoris]